MDVLGPAPVLSKTGSHFYFSIVDAFSRYTWLFPIKCKSDVLLQFVSFQQIVERFSNHKSSTIQFDWGGEFHSLNTFLVP